MTQAVAFEFLFERLRREGFRLGVDHQLRLQELLEKVECAPEDLGYVLAPLYATSPAQQKRFLEIFDEVFGRYGMGPNRSPKPVVKRNWRLVWTTGLLVMMLIRAGAAAWQYRDELVKPWCWLMKTGCPDKQAQGTPAPGPVDANPRPEVEQGWRNYPVVLEGQAAAVRMVEQRWGRWALVWLPMLGVVYFYRRRALRQRTALGREKILPPPDYWPLRVDPMGHLLYPAARVKELAGRMRRRQDSEIEVLDVEQTIRETVRQGGYPRFQYERLRRAPEYLVLLERQSPGDHFAEFQAELFRLLQTEGVLQQRFFFEGDPRRVSGENGHEWRLEQLLAKYGEHRLLVVTASGALVHPLTGRLESWVEDVLGHWRERALLLVDAPGGRRLRRLREAGFVVAAAETKGVQEVVEYFAHGGRESGRSEPEFCALEAADPASRWLAACAVYPELNWNLTLRLGTEELTERRVSAMARNRWLREGMIPEGERQKLMAWMPEEDRQRISRVLEATLRENEPKETGSLAHANWAATMRLFDQRQAAAKPEDGVEVDATLLRFLREGEEPAAVMLDIPERNGWDWAGAAVCVAASVAAVGLLLWLQPMVMAVRNQGVRLSAEAEAGARTNGVRVKDGDRVLDLSQPVVVYGKNVIVQTPRPLWTKEVRQEAGNEAVIVVGNGRPENLAFQLDQWTASMEVRAGELVRIPVDYAGKIEGVTLERGGGRLRAMVPFTGKEGFVVEGPDGLEFLFRAEESETVRWMLTPVGGKGEWHETRLEVKGRAPAKEAWPVVSFQIAPRTVGAPGEEVTASWEVKAGSAGVRDLSLVSGEGKTMRRMLRGLPLQGSYKFAVDGNQQDYQIVVTDERGRTFPSPLLRVARQEPKVEQRSYDVILTMCGVEETKEAYFTVVAGKMNQPVKLEQCGKSLSLLLGRTMGGELADVADSIRVVIDGQSTGAAGYAETPTGVNLRFYSPVQSEGQVRMPVYAIELRVQASRFAPAAK